VHDLGDEPSTVVLDGSPTTLERIAAAFDDQELSDSQTFRTICAIIAQARARGEL
jgi:hypothetical protein